MSYVLERVPIIAHLREFFSRKLVPKHKFTFVYFFGGMSLFLFVVQLLTGVLLSLYYSPDPDRAHESIVRIVKEVNYGWFVRSLHSWGANLMVGFVLVHMFTVFFTRAYRRPREAMWFSGVILLFLVLGFAFTGYLLPWDITAYHATQIGTEIPKSIPVVGELAIQLLRGENELGSEALRRMYALHVIILPLTTILLISFHVILQQVLGSSIPPGVSPKGYVAFLPNFLYRDLLNWTLVSAILVILSSLLPVELGEKANPLASAPAGIKPEWYFLPLYQILRIFPARILTINGEMLVNCFVLVSAIFWFCIPLIDARRGDDVYSPLLRFVGIIIIVFSISMVVMAYTI